MTAETKGAQCLYVGATAVNVLPLNLGIGTAGVFTVYEKVDA